MFWVHGGGFTSGTGEAGNDLARLGEVDEDLIVVAINYRVGPLGFEASCALFLPNCGADVIIEAFFTFFP